MQQNLSSLNNYNNSMPQGALGAHQGMVAMPKMQYQAQPIQSIPQTVTPNAVSINIINPQAFANPNMAQNQIQPMYPNYPMYGTAPQGGYYYPSNYNNLISQPQQGGLNALNEVNLRDKTPNSEIEQSKMAEKVQENKEKKDKKPKKITVLTDEYIKNLENYLNDGNPKVRLIGAKELLERFKEDETRVDNPSLTALLNKSLRDTSPSVRFLGLTSLQLGYSKGNDETIQILKEIQATNKDKFGEDALLASEILLKLSAPQKVETEVKE